MIENTMAFAEEFDNVVLGVVDMKDLAVFVQNETMLKNLFSLFTFEPNNLYLSYILPKYISRFAKNNFQKVDDYIRRSELSDCELAISFIRFLRSENLFDAILQDHKSYYNDVQKSSSYEHIVNNVLLERNYCENINIFGFGLGDGSYELSLKKMLKTHQKINNAEIFGYEPFYNDTAYKNFASSDLLTIDNIKFDIIIARWSLHHVVDTERWGNFIASLNLLKPDGTAVIIEHGFVNRAFDFNCKQLYLFFNVIIDVIGNTIFNYDWLSKVEGSKDYFIKFLDDDAIKYFIEKCIPDLKYYVKEETSVFPNNSVIVLS